MHDLTGPEITAQLLARKYEALGQFWIPEEEYLERYRWSSKSQRKELDYRFDRHVDPKGRVAYLWGGDADTPRWEVPEFFTNTSKVFRDLEKMAPDGWCVRPLGVTPTQMRSEGFVSAVRYDQPRRCNTTVWRRPHWPPIQWKQANHQTLDDSMRLLLEVYADQGWCRLPPGVTPAQMRAYGFTIEYADTNTLRPERVWTHDEWLGQIPPTATGIAAGIMRAHAACANPRYAAQGWCCLPKGTTPQMMKWAGLVRVRFKVLDRTYRMWRNPRWPQPKNWDGLDPKTEAFLAAHAVQGWFIRPRGLSPKGLRRHGYYPYLKYFPNDPRKLIRVWKHGTWVK